MEYKDLELNLELVMKSLVGVDKRSYPIKWGNYFSVYATNVDGTVLNLSPVEDRLAGKSYYPVINMNAENFYHLLENGTLTQPIKTRLLIKEPMIGIAIIDERISQEFYRLWTRGYCNSHLDSNLLKEVANNLTERFTSLDDNLNYTL